MVFRVLDQTVDFGETTTVFRIYVNIKPPYFVYMLDMILVFCLEDTYQEQVYAE